MVMNILERLFEDGGSMPNSFSLGMGELIRKGREEIGMSQAKLAKRIYRRQASLSDMENGKMQPDAETLMMLALTLNKPIAYFFPHPYGKYLELKKLSILEQELLFQVKMLDVDDQKRIIAQVRALNDLNRDK